MNHILLDLQEIVNHPVFLNESPLVSILKSPLVSILKSPLVNLSVSILKSHNVSLVVVPLANGKLTLNIYVERQAPRTSLHNQRSG